MLNVIAAVPVAGLPADRVPVHATGQGEDRPCVPEVVEPGRWELRPLRRREAPGDGRRASGPPTVHIRATLRPPAVATATRRRSRHCAHRGTPGRPYQRADSD